MSIYANSSESYWKERQKKPEKRPALQVISIVLLVVVAFVCSALYVKNKRNSTTRIVQRRSLHEATLDQKKECESRVNSRHECVSICLPERNSIHKKTMHQACLHGCQQAHAASTALGCRGMSDEKNPKQKHKDVTEEDVFEVVGVLAYNHCAEYQSVNPKPEVFATCRKYHRAGTKQGFRLGVEAMNKVLDEEWATAQIDP